MARVSQGATLRNQKREAAAGALCRRGGGISPAELLAGLGFATPSGRVVLCLALNTCAKAFRSFHPEKPSSTMHEREV